MLPSNFWVLENKTPHPIISCTGLQLDPVSILEITEDGAAFLWPIEPDRGDLCLYCQKRQGVPDALFYTRVYHNSHCLIQQSSQLPCGFVAVENPEHQDLDGYLLDGASREAGGYYLGLKQFLQGHDISPDDLTISPLGAHINIASARAAWAVHLTCSN